MNKLMIIYSRYKEAAYLSKEDIVETFKCIFRRANIFLNKDKKNNEIIRGIDISPIGVPSIYEVLEVELFEEYKIPFLIKELNLVSISGFTILSAKYIDSSLELEKAVYASKYIIEFDDINNNEISKTDIKIASEKKEFADKMIEFLKQEYVLVLKKSKDRMERIDIKANILQVAKIGDFSVEVIIKKDSEITDVLDILVGGYIEYIGTNINVSIKRTKIIFND